MKIIIFANGDRGLEVLKKINKTFNVQALITLTTKVELFRKVLPREKVFAIENINKQSSIKFLREFESDIFLVAGFSQIFSEEILGIPKLGIINLHAGKLPYYRGGSPLNWQLLNGEKQVGISALLMDSGIDTGNILAENLFPIDADDDIKKLHFKSNMLFPKLAEEAILELKKGNKGKIQNNNNACYWHQRQDKDGEIIFDKLTALQVHLLIKSLVDPYPGAWAKLNNSKIIFKKSVIPDILIKGIPGKIIFLGGRGPYIICKDRAILVTDYNCPGNQTFKLKSNMYFK